MYLISPEKKQYKANLHSHSTFSDGKLSPEAMKQAYKETGIRSSPLRIMSTHRIFPGCRSRIF